MRPFLLAALLCLAACSQGWTEEDIALFTRACQDQARASATSDDLRMLNGGCACTIQTLARSFPHSYAVDASRAYETSRAMSWSRLACGMPERMGTAVAVTSSRRTRASSPAPPTRVQ
jgi:hypothetical protein